MLDVVVVVVVVIVIVVVVVEVVVVVVVIQIYMILIQIELVINPGRTGYLSTLTNIFSGYNNPAISGLLSSHIWIVIQI